MVGLFLLNILLICAPVIDQEHEDGSELCGILRCVDIGIPESYVNEISSGTESPC